MVQRLVRHHHLSFRGTLGTKLRALYQRKKGRDLFDLYMALTQDKTAVDWDAVIRCYRRYVAFVVAQPSTRKQFLLNMEEKMYDTEFRGDSQLLIRPEIGFNPDTAYALEKDRLIDQLLASK